MPGLLPADKSRQAKAMVLGCYSGQSLAMTATIHIAPTTALHPGIAALAAEATGEGFHFVGRLVDDWTSGSNRFEQRGERLLGALWGNDLAAVCGLNCDPYIERDGVGRLRHLYVRKAARRHGIGAALVQRLLDEASTTFHLVRLRTATAEAAAFYHRLGFMSVEDDTASHVIALRRDRPIEQNDGAVARTAFITPATLAAGQ
jgi:GNAT superfamily N-acetyltransferase